ncbi:mannonate dehydratase [Alteribacillus sp. YIM 98480]|uniref:mannonate dehydratase n=1 Tax=Alteribacillus sp. YIM 98480 TaxID=2606599 RepID=UPI00131E2E53|nr:mannonate dehydratase [Alteribacillus sp. YIM 98480]
MKMTMRWFGETDRVKLEDIRQIPGLTGIVSAIYDIPAGEVWPKEKIRKLKNKIESYGMTLDVIESVPVHEDIKLGRSTRDYYIANYQQTLRYLADEGVGTVCYNFMPVFDWTRSKLDYKYKDGSTALIYENEVILETDPLSGSLELPGWDLSYGNQELKTLIDDYQSITEEDMWENLRYFLNAIMPVAEEVKMKMAIHPDDPPWSIFGLPRIITSEKNLERVLRMYDHPLNGLTLCSGSLGADKNNNIPQMVRRFGKEGRIHFAHVRNVKRTGERSFYETSHLSSDGSLDIADIMKAYAEIKFDGPLRPDHGRMIWGEKGRPGYGLYDRSLGASYLNGLYEAFTY